MCRCEISSVFSTVWLIFKSMVRAIGVAVFTLGAWDDVLVWGMAKLVRRWLLVPPFCGFESRCPNLLDFTCLRIKEGT